jgi:hypothetical protein
MIAWISFNFDSPIPVQQDPMMTRRPSVCIKVITLIALAVNPTFAADKPDTSPEINQLKLQLTEQQRQIDELRAALREQREMMEANRHPAAEAPAPPAAVQPSGSVRQLGQVASTTPIIPVAPAVTAPLVLPMPTAAAPQKVETAETPLQLRIGSATITPVGFMDFTAVYRSSNPGSGIGTSFGSIPYNTAVNGNISEFRLSAQNSRIGLRVDAKVHGANVLGYLESDFLGFLPTNAAVTNNADTLRLRLYWVDVRKDKLEILGGQSWSMLVPNRKGLSALPSDLFYSQDIDVNYQAGLVWSRNPQFRFIVHPSEKVAMGLSLEATEQYIGGSGGGGVVTLPSALATPYANQLNSGATSLSVPGVHPDIIAKVAFDPNSRAHFEVAGLFRTFRVYDPLSTTHNTAHGYGGSVNFNFGITKNLHLVSNNYWSDGGGRWIFGLAPDVIVRADGTLSPIHSGSTVDGFELQAKNTLLYAYYGGVYVGRDFVLDTTAKKPALVGYGYTGSGNGQNRTIQEPTFGITQTFWKDPKYGALQFMVQYSYVLRYPWFVATNTPKDAHASMLFLNLRYLLPGSAPRIEP